MYELHVSQLSLESSIIFYGPVGSEVISQLRNRNIYVQMLQKKPLVFVFIHVSLLFQHYTF